MGSGVGLQTVFGSAEESSYGTPVVVDRWFELLSETLTRGQNVVQSSGLRPGSRNLRRGARRAVTHRWGGGDVNLEVANKGFGRWFKHMLGGTPVSTQPDATNSPSVYLHTFEMGSLLGKSQTVQKGVRDQAGTELESFTFHGVKVATWGLRIAVGEILNLRLGLDAEDVDTTTALAAHTYGNPGLFHFAQGDVLLDDVSVARVLSVEANGNNALRTDGFFLGTGGLKGEPEPNDFPTVDGRISAEFNDPATFYDRYTSDAATKLVLEFVGPVITDDETYLLRLTIPEIHFTGGTPEVGGPGVVTPDIPFEGAYDGTNQSVKIEYQTDEATP